jgi:SpoVK/Ycf46/Vps4 family AAA+-type ATPase
MKISQSLSDQLRAHIESHYPILLLATFEEHDADALIKGATDRRRILEWDMARGQVDFATKRALSTYDDLAAALSTWLEMELDDHILIVKDAHLALRDNPLAIARLKALANKIVYDEHTRATVFLVSSQPCVQPELEKFITLFELPLPDEAAIKQLVLHYAQDRELALPQGTADKLAPAFRGLSRHEIRQLLNRSYQQDGQIGSKDVDLVLAEKEQVIRKSGILEMVQLREKLDDIGGLARLKAWLKQKATVLANLAEARAFGVEAPKGIMIVGMPGCGKSLTAKAAAQLFGLPLLRLDVGSLMGKYVGESEANMRRALKQADAVSPCVLWIDELEKAFVGMGSGAAGSEVASRLFGYFLTWMQEKTSPVFVLATANDISALPPELLRKGRFDEIFYVDFPSEGERAEILKLHLERRGKPVGSIDCQRLAAGTEGFSGADLEAVIKESIEQAFVNGKVELSTQGLLGIIRETQPLSVVMKEKVREYKEKFNQTRIKPAS